MNVNKEKLIAEMAKIIDDRLIEARNCLGSMNRGEGYWIAQKLVDLYQPKINKDKWKRILDRNRKELQRLKDKEENLSKFGQHDLGYFKGRVSVLEDLFDELDIEVNGNE